MDQSNFDAAYLVRLRDRDPGTLDHFCDYFHTRIRSYAVHNLPGGMANDFVQDVFVTVLTRVDAGEPQDPGKLAAYVYGVARLLTLQGYRTIGKTQVTDIDPGLFPDLQDRADIRMIRELNANLVRRLIGRLSARDRDAILRVFFREQDRPTAAREMGISQECLRTILCRALKRFRREWDNIQEWMSSQKLPPAGKKRRDL